jgi:hypothetical protein
LYFDERPKERPEDFYDREEEMRQLLHSLKGGVSYSCLA